MLRDPMTVGQRFKKLRTDKGFSQADVSEGICSYTMISLLENDKKVPSPKIMGKLAERLGIPLREIMGQDDKSFETEFQLDLLRVYLEMGDFHQADALAEFLSQSRELLEHQRYELLKCRAKCWLGLRRSSEAIEALEGYLERYEKSGGTDEERLCTLYNLLGSAHYEAQDTTRAYSCYSRAYRSSFKFSNLEALAADVAYNCGMICNQLGMLDEANFYLSKAHEFYASVLDLKHLADTFFHLAIANKDEEAIKQALSIYESLNIVKKAHLARQYYAFHIKSKTDYAAAVSDLTDIATEFERADDLEMCIYTFSRAAMICLDHRDLERAAGALNEVDKQLGLVRSKRSRRIAYFYFVKSRYYLMIQEYEQCITLGEKGGIIFREVGMEKSYADVMYVVAEAYFQMGKYEDAYKIQKSVSNSLLRQEVSEK